MASELKTLIPKVESYRTPPFFQTQHPGPRLPFNLTDLQQVGAVFALIMIAIWTPQGRVNTIVSLLAAFCIVWFTVPWKRDWQYAIWSLQQEFILQSFFFVRLESALGGRHAAVRAALLFCIAHVPSPLLTVLGFIGGLIFCELFRRYRNLYPLGVVHAVLGLTIAATLPDSLLHHMRVGLGYLLYRP